MKGKQDLPCAVDSCQSWMLGMGSKGLGHGRRGNYSILLLVMGIPNIY